MNWETVKAVLSRYEKDILALPEVTGISSGVSKGAPEEFCIKVYLSKKICRGELKKRCLPLNIEGISIEAIISGEMIAL